MLEVKTGSSASAREEARGGAAPHRERGLYTSHRASENMSSIGLEQPSNEPAKYWSYFVDREKNKLQALGPT